MTACNPLLRDDEFVAYSAISPRACVAGGTDADHALRERIEALVADAGPHRFDALMLDWEE